MTFQSQYLGTDQTAVLRLRLSKQFLHNLVAGRLAFAVAPFCLSTIESNKHNDARNGTTHHAHPTYATSKSGSYALGHRLIQSIQVAKGCDNTLAASVSGHKIINGTSYSLIQILWVVFHIICNIHLAKLRRIWQYSKQVAKYLVNCS